MIVRDGVSLRQAATILQLPLTTQDCRNIERRKSYQKLLWAARHRYYAEIASDPQRTKVATIGNLQLLAQRLMDEGQYEKTAEVLFKLAKMEGWVGPESNVNVFGSLSHKDLQNIREELKKEAHAQLVH